MSNNLLNDYIKLSTTLGTKLEDVQGGGGNASVKINDKVMIVKESGKLLKDISINNLGSEIHYHNVKKWLEEFDGYINHENDIILEQIVSENTINSKKASIETSMHTIFKEIFVFHNHSIYINIFSCSKDGIKLLKKIIGSFELIDYSSPGLGLGIELRNKKINNDIIILKNHGIIIKGNDINNIINTYKNIINNIKDYLKSNKIKLFDNDCYKNDGETYIGEFKHGNMLDKIINLSTITNHIYPDSVVFGKSINIKEICKIKDLFIEVKNQKNSYFIENMLAINYILYVQNLLNIYTNYISVKDVNYIENINQEKYRQKI